jgi:hypothetical protein
VCSSPPPPPPQIVVSSSIETDGGKAWKVTLPENAFSFEEVYKQNQKLDVSECQALGAAAHKRVAQALETLERLP